jgi:hypothetical protein
MLTQMSWSPHDPWGTRVRVGAQIAGLLALTGAIAIAATAGAAATTTCEAKQGSKATDDVGRTFSPLYSCSTKVQSAVYANPFDRRALDDSGVMDPAADVPVVCQKQGRANPALTGAATNNWWLYTKGNKALPNGDGYSQGWGYLPANAVTQATKDQQVPGVPPCPDLPPPVSRKPPPPPPPPPPPGGCTDCDGDRFPSNVDCNDRVAAINPGATDIPGNALDEDCSGSPAPFPRLDSTIGYAFDKAGKRTVFTKLTVRPARGGSIVRVSCTGRGCPFKAKTRAVRKDARELNLSRLVRRAKLGSGARLEVRVAKVATIGIVRRLTVRAGKGPTDATLCLTPGAKRATRCAL